MGTMKFIESRFAEYNKGGAPRRSIRSKSVQKDYRFDFEAMTVKMPDGKIVKCKRVVAEEPAAERDEARSERYPVVPAEGRAKSSSEREVKAPPKSKAEVPPGAKGDPLRGLSVHYLSTTLTKEIAEAGCDEKATVRNIEPKVIRCPRAAETICPRDGELGAAYVDIVDGEENVGRATHMLSYTWSYVFKDIVDSLVAWCKQNKKDPKTIRIWMCCFCINQYRVIKAQEAGLVVPFEEFRKEFESRVRGIGQVLALMGSWQMTLYVQRVWCVFELYTAMMLQATDPTTYNLTLVMSPKEAEEFREKLLEGHGMESVWKALNHIKVEKADAFVKEDRDRILQLVEEGPGYARMNKEIVEKLHEWFTNNSERYLRQELKGSSRRRSHDNLALACTRVGQMLEQTSHFKAALELLETGKKMLESDGKVHSKEGEELLRILGTAHRRLGKLEDAYEAYEEAKVVHEQLDDTKCSSYAMLLQDIGRIHGDYSDLEEELKCHEQAFAIRKELGLLDTPEGAMLFRSLGMVYFQKYEYAKAQEFFEKAKAMHEKTDSLKTPEGAAALQSIGDVLSSMFPPKHAEALRVLEEAFAISEQLGISKTSKGVAQLRRIAFLHKMLGDHKKAARTEKMANELEDMVNMAASAATAAEESQEAEMESQRSVKSSPSKAKAIEEIKPGWGCYFEVVNDDGFSDPSNRGFPHQLTTFQTAATVQIKPRHMKIHWGNLDTLTVEGREWSLDTDTLLDKSPELKLLKGLVNHGQVKGYLSPLHEVNLADAAKEAAGIPQKARHFMFSYPVTFEAAPDGKHMPDSKNSDLAFLANGGFVYLDESATTVIRMNAVSPAVAGGLRFGPPLKWEPQWTQRLLHANRLRPITVKVIRETGATHFCWIRPNEVMWFGESGGTPICPFGGFAYIYLDESMKEKAMEDARGGRGGSSLGKRRRSFDDEGAEDAPAPARARHGR